MKLAILIPTLFHLAVSCVAQTGDAAGSEASSLNTRYAVSTIDDATFYRDIRPPLPQVLNQVLVEPSFSLRYHDRLSFSTSLIGLTSAYFDTNTRLHVKEAYTGLSAGDFDFTAGRKVLHWGTGYAFTAVGVLDPPRNPTDPTDRLNVNEGRDMIKADWVRGRHALTVAWSTAALAPAHTQLHDVAAFRYNVLVRGFDTALQAGNDRGSDSFGGLTFTRVIGQGWEIHGEALWRDQAAALVGAKCTLHSGVTFIGELYSPPNTAYFRDATVSQFASRQHYAFLYAGKSRLRELPGWKEWDVSGSIVTNLDDHSFTGVIDVNRWFGNHFSSYVHIAIPRGAKQSDYGAVPYTAATSVGVRFHL